MIIPSVFYSRFLNNFQNHNTIVVTQLYDITSTPVWWKRVREQVSKNVSLEDTCGVRNKSNHGSLGCRLIMNDQTICYLLLVLPLWFLSSVHIIKSFFSYPDVDHDPLHDASDAKKHRKEPVRPKTTFTRDKIQKIA